MGKRRAKAPAGCYWRYGGLYGRVKINGRDFRWPLHTSDPKIATARQKAGKDRLIADAYHGDSPRSVIEAMEGWAGWVVRRVSAKTVQRYACSLDQLRPFIESKRLADIDGRLIAEIIRAREADGVTNATIKRDLVALSSVINYAIDQGWLESNPVLARMKRVKEVREPILLPRAEDVALVLERAPGMIKDMVRVAIATGLREAELLKARREDVDHGRRQISLKGKGGKRRTLDLDPFNGYELIRSLPSYVGSPLLFWHSAGESYKNFASNFKGVTARAASWAADRGIEFRPFRFHDLRHLHAIQFLKSGRSIYELQQRLGHASIKTTEMYLRAGFLTFEEQQAAISGSSAAPSGAPASRRGAGEA